MAQPQKYERSHDFAGDEADDIDRSALNSEFDNASTSINGIRENLAAIQNDDQSLKPGIVSVVNLTDEAVDTLTRSVDAKSELAVAAADRAESAARSVEGAAIDAKSYSDRASQVVSNTEQALSVGINKINQICTTQESVLKTAVDQMMNSEIGITCQEQIWTVESDTAADTAITIPNGMAYLVGRHHLLVNWNGIELMRGTDFDEVGDTDTKSSKIKIHFKVSSGDILRAWTAALGRGLTDDLVKQVNTNTDAIADLSAKVVYKDEQSASSSSSSGS